MNRFPSHQVLTCTEVQDTLEAYLDDALDADMHAKVASHIGSCATCQDEVRFAQAIGGALRELPKPEPPPEIFDAVAAHVRTHPNKGQSWRHRIFQRFTFTDALIPALARVGALACLIGIIVFGAYRYRQYTEVKQASRDFYYALGKLNYAVERTGTVVSDKLPNVRINEVSSRPFVQIESASRRALKEKEKISSAIHQSLGAINRLPEYIPDIKHYEHSDYKGDTP